MFLKTVSSKGSVDTRPKESIAGNGNLLSTKSQKLNVTLNLLAFLSFFFFFFSLYSACCSNAMTAIATAAALSLPISLYRPAKINTKKVLFFIYWNF